MNANRKADLQRKLTLVSIPKPPAGLAERIKTDIPKHLTVDTEGDRRRLRTAVAFNMRVAAAILLLVGSLFFALHLLNSVYQDENARVAGFEQALKKDRAPAPALSPVPHSANAPQVVTSTSQPPATVAPPKPQEAWAEPREAKTKQETKAQTTAQTMGRLADAQPPRSDQEEVRKESEVAYDKVAAASSRPAPPAPPPVAEPVPQVTEQIQVAAEAPSQPERAKAPTSKTATIDFVPSLQAAGFAYGPPTTLFGYAIAGKSLDGVTPLVQHFSAPDGRPRHGVRVEMDAAPSPLDASRDVVRFSIDTASNSGAPGSSPAPVAADAKLEIDFNRDAVASYRAVTGQPSSKERALVEGVSVTALYEAELKPSLPGRTRVATVRLTYRSLPDGRERTIKREVRAGDVAKSWDAASPRTKKASLAAAFGEIRARGGDTTPIVEKARSIGLDELAALAGR